MELRDDMYHINVTVQIEEDGVRLTRGTPQELGLENVSSHMLLTYADEEVMLWVVGKLERAEKQNVINGVYEYLDETFGVTASTMEEG